MLSSDSEEVRQALDLKAQHVQVDDIERVAQNRSAVEALIEEIPSSLPRSRSQARVLFEFVAAQAETSSAPLEVVAQAVGALLYLSSPLDLVPDTEEDGYLDDAAILELAVRRLEPTLRPFCEQKGIDPTEIF